MSPSKFPSLSLAAVLIGLAVTGCSSGFSTPVATGRVSPLADTVQSASIVAVGTATLSDFVAHLPASLPSDFVVPPLEDFSGVIKQGCLPAATDACIVELDPTAVVKPQPLYADFLNRALSQGWSLDGAGCGAENPVPDAGGTQDAECTATSSDSSASVKLSWTGTAPSMVVTLDATALGKHRAAQKSLQVS